MVRQVFKKELEIKYRRLILKWMLNNMVKYIIDKEEVQKKWTMKKRGNVKETENIF